MKRLCRQGIRSLALVVLLALGNAAVAGGDPTSVDLRDAAALRAARELRPTTVVLSAQWEKYPSLDGLRRTVAELRRSGVAEIVVVGPSPSWPIGLAQALFKQVKRDGLDRFPLRVEDELSDAPPLADRKLWPQGRRARPVAERRSPEVGSKGGANAPPFVVPGRARGGAKHSRTPARYRSGRLGSCAERVRLDPASLPGRGRASAGRKNHAHAPPSCSPGPRFACATRRQPWLAETRRRSRR